MLFQGIAIQQLLLDAATDDAVFMCFAGLLRDRLVGAVASLRAIFRQAADVLSVHRHAEGNDAGLHAQIYGIHRQPGCHHTPSAASDPLHLLFDLPHWRPTNGQPGSQNSTAQGTNRGKEENDEADGG